MRTWGRAIGMVAAMMLGWALTACGGGTTVVSGDQASGITVHASAEVKVVPDVASFTVEVYAEGATASEAEAAGSPVVNDVVAALRDAGIEDKDIQTSYTSVSPIYDWGFDATEGEPRITGYEMRATLQVSGVPIDQVSGLMESCVAAGATGVSGPSYYASSYDEAYAQALADAVAASRPKAEAMAEAAGVTLGKVVAVTEGYENTSYRYDSLKAASTEDSLDTGGGAMEVMPGEVTIEAQVTVVYALG